MRHIGVRHIIEGYMYICHKSDSLSTATSESQKGLVLDCKSWTTTLQIKFDNIMRNNCWIIIVHDSRSARSSDWKEDIALTLQPKPSMTLPLNLRVNFINFFLKLSHSKK